MNSTAQLKAAKTLISSPTNWCHGARAKNPDGWEVEVLSGTASQFCLLGALLRGNKNIREDVLGAEEFLDAATKTLCGTRLNYIGFNELREHDEVLELLDFAISASERYDEEEAEKTFRQG